MKAVSLMTYFIGLAMLVTVGSSRAYAQFEVDPDHYETRDAEPLPQSRTNSPGQAAKIHYEGNFTLRYSLRFNRSSLSRLPPGKYSIAVDSEGRTVRVTVSRGGHTMRIDGVTQRQNQKHRWNVLVVERIRPILARILPPLILESAALFGRFSVVPLPAFLLAVDGAAEASVRDPVTSYVSRISSQTHSETLFTVV